MTSQGHSGLHLQLVSLARLQYILLIGLTAGSWTGRTAAEPVTQLTTVGLLQLASFSQPERAEQATSTSCYLSGQVQLLGGPSVSLPARTNIVGCPCPASRSHDFLDSPAGSCPKTTLSHTDDSSNDTSDGSSDGSGARRLSSLDLSSLVALFTVPPNGSVSVRCLNITGALLTAKAVPISPAAFLLLSIFRLPAQSPANLPSVPRAPPLQLHDLFITTPSCAALLAHQITACALSPSSNFTVTPTSLVVHMYDTPTVSFRNVSLTCPDSPPVPPPCVATAAATGAEALSALAWLQSQSNILGQQGHGGFIPKSFLFIERDIALLPSLASMPSSADAYAGWAPPLAAALTVSPGVIRTPVFRITSMDVVIAGRTDGTTVLDLSSTANLIEVIQTATVLLANLTLARPPAGLINTRPYGFYCLGMWTFTFARRLLGGIIKPLLTLRDVTVMDVPEAEVAMFYGDLNFDRQQVPPPPPHAQPASLRPPPPPPPLQGPPMECQCASYNMLLYGSSAWVPQTGQMFISRANSRSTRMVLERVRVSSAASGSIDGSGGNGDGETMSAINSAAATTPAPLPPSSHPPCRSTVLCQLAPYGANSTTWMVTTFPERTPEVALWSRAQRETPGAPSHALTLTHEANTLNVAQAAKLRLPVGLVGDPFGLCVLDVRGVTASVDVRSFPEAIFTVRHLILVGLPPATAPRAPRVQIRRRRRVTAEAGTAAAAAGGSSDAVGTSAAAAAAAEAEAGRRPARRQLRQAAASDEDQGGSGGVGITDALSRTQGLPDAMTNFTSCTWWLVLDRQAVAAAALARAETATGNTTADAASSWNALEAPPVTLESVTLVIPSLELRVLVGTWATRSPESITSDPGLAAQLRIMLAVSELDTASAAIVAAATASEPTPGLASAFTTAAKLTFTRLLWCGVVGRNLTLASAPPQLPAWADMSAVSADAQRPPANLLLPVRPLEWPPPLVGPRSSEPPLGEGPELARSLLPTSPLSPSPFPWGPGPPSGASGVELGPTGGSQKGAATESRVAKDPSSGVGDGVAPPPGGRPPQRAALVAGCVCAGGVAAASAAGLVLLLRRRQQRLKERQLDEGNRAMAAAEDASEKVGAGAGEDGGAGGGDEAWVDSWDGSGGLGPPRDGPTCRHILSAGLPSSGWAGCVATAEQDSDRVGGGGREAAVRDVHEGHLGGCGSGPEGSAEPTAGTAAAGASPIVVRTSGMPPVDMPGATQSALLPGSAVGLGRGQEVGPYRSLTSLPPKSLQGSPLMLLSADGVSTGPVSTLTTGALAALLRSESATATTTTGGGGGFTSSDCTASQVAQLIQSSRNAAMRTSNRQHAAPPPGESMGTASTIAAMASCAGGRHPTLAHKAKPSAPATARASTRGKSPPWAPSAQGGLAVEQRPRGGGCGRVGTSGSGSESLAASDPSSPTVVDRALQSRIRTTLAQLHRTVSEWRERLLPGGSLSLPPSPSLTVTGAPPETSVLRGPAAAPATGTSLAVVPAAASAVWAAAAGAAAAPAAAIAGICSVSSATAARAHMGTHPGCMYDSSSGGDGVIIADPRVDSSRTACGGGGGRSSRSAAAEWQPQPSRPGHDHDGASTPEDGTVMLVITGELGRGAQGVVYGGTWRGLPVAVKNVLLYHQPSSTPGCSGPGPSPNPADLRVTLAIREAAISATAAHPNLVATYTYMLQRLEEKTTAAAMPPSGGASGVGTGTSASPPPGGGTGTATGSLLSSTRNAGEMEMWKLTLVQELCDGNSVRHCLERSGTLAAAVPAMKLLARWQRRRRRRLAASARVAAAAAAVGMATGEGEECACQGGGPSRSASPASGSGSKPISGDGTGAGSKGQAEAGARGSTAQVPAAPPQASPAAAPQPPHAEADATRPPGALPPPSPSPSPSPPTTTVPPPPTMTTVLPQSRTVHAAARKRVRAHTAAVGTLPEVGRSRDAADRRSGGGSGTIGGSRSRPTGRLQPTTTGDRAPATPVGACDGPRKRLHPVVMLCVALQAARGLEHLHDKSIVHADVSSSNILLKGVPTPPCRGRRARAAAERACLYGSGDGSCFPYATYGYVAKLCDFGQSGRLGLGGDQAVTHLSGPARRSSVYSPPELVRHGRAGPPGDVYALAVVLWEMAHGSALPALLASPEGAAVQSWLQQQTRGDPAEAEALPSRLLTWPPGLPAGYPELVGECLREVPGERPTAGQVQRRLQEMLQVACEHAVAGGEAD